MAKYIQATMSAGIDFHIRKQSKGSPVAQTVKVIHVNGGANVRDKNSIFTPVGAVTEVSDEDYALLLKDPTFKQLVENGGIVANDNHHLDVKDNKPKDNSAQKTPEHYEQTRKGKESPTPTTEPIGSGE